MHFSASPFPAFDSTKDVLSFHGVVEACELAARESQMPALLAEMF